MIKRYIGFFVLIIFIIACSGCEGCRGSGTLSGNKYIDSTKYKFSIQKKSSELFFDIKSDEDIRISKNDQLGIFLNVIPPGSKLYNRDPKKLLLNFIPVYKRNVSSLVSEKKKNRKMYIHKQSAYEAWFMGDLAWTPTQYVMWGLVRKSDRTGFIIVLKCPFKQWDKWKKKLLATAKSFKIIR